MNRRVTSSLCLVASGLLMFSVSSSALACGDDAPYLGSVCFSVTSYCPMGYLDANGQALSTSQYEGLYTLLGTTYGGSGSTFNLPDLRGRVPVGQGTGTGLTPAIQGQQRGAESVLLNVLNLPPHSHQATFTPGSASPLTLNATTTPATSPTPTDTINQLGTTTVPAVRIYAPSGGTQVSLAGVGGAPITVQPTGSAVASVATITPQSMLRACIAVSGVFPPQP